VPTTLYISPSQPAYGDSAALYTQPATIIGNVIQFGKLKVPNWITFPMIVAGWVYSAALSPYAGWEGLGWSLLGTVIGLALLLPLYSIGGMGAGDVKLLAAFGALLGPADVFDAFLRAAILGGAMALTVALWRGRLRETLYGTAMLVTTRSRTMTATIEHPAANNRFPYAPAIACGAVLVVLGW